ncbi:ionotropic receptor 21a-like [Palaemon carinicauda]|uniref:ionotropic receptor 21a-like n=1 Tax=Palaemon carinicauda TaxID=392227 RepID=UPI0035B67672
MKGGLMSTWVCTLLWAVSSANKPSQKAKQNIDYLLNSSPEISVPTESISIGIAQAHLDSKVVPSNTMPTEELSLSTNLQRSPNSSVPVVVPSARPAILSSNKSHSEAKPSGMLSSLVNEDLEADFEEEGALERLLVTLVEQYLMNCDLIIIFSRSFKDTKLLKTLVFLPNQKQLASINDQGVAGHINWVSKRCLGVFILSMDLEPLLDFGNRDMTSWSYAARVVVVGLTKEELENLAETKKAKKTEHLLGIVKGSRPSHYFMYTNQLYQGKGLAYITSWGKRNSGISDEIFPDKIANFHGVPLTVVTFEFPPSIIYRKGQNGELLFRFGWEIAIVEALSRVFNFSIIYTEPPSGELWGTKLPNGSWNGMVALMGSGKGDIGIANIFVTGDLGRREFQEFSTPFTGVRSCFLTRMEPPLPKWQSLGLPFKLETWVAIFAGFFITGPMLHLLSISGSRRGYERSNLQSVIFSTFYAVGAHFRHPNHLLPTHASSRIFVASLWIYAILLTTGYSSNLTAFLTISRQPSSMETFKELFESRRQIHELVYFFQSQMADSENKYLRALAERFEYLKTLADIKKKVLNGEGVMIQSQSYLEYTSAQLTTPQGRPLVRIMKECFLPYSVALAYQSNAPLKAKFDTAITWMFESGLERRWFFDAINLSEKFRKMDKKILESQPDSESPENDENAFTVRSGVIPLGIDHMQGLFIILLFGYLISIISFVTESLIG